MANASDLVETITANLDVVRGRIAVACDRAGRDPGTVRLVGISKTFPIEQAVEAFEASADPQNIKVLLKINSS